MFSSTYYKLTKERQPTLGRRTADRRLGWQCMAPEFRHGKLNEFERGCLFVNPHVFVVMGKPSRVRLKHAPLLRWSWYTLDSVLAVSV
jgi:hypothetical protein